MANGPRTRRCRSRRIRVPSYTHAVSSPGLTGRPSIPEKSAIETMARGVLDRPVKPGDDSLC
jgi:hypothetical protein